MEESVCENARKPEQVVNRRSSASGSSNKGYIEKGCIRFDLHQLSRRDERRSPCVGPSADSIPFAHDARSAILECICEQIHQLIVEQIGLVGLISKRLHDVDVVEYFRDLGL